MSRSSGQRTIASLPIQPHSLRSDRAHDRVFDAIYDDLRRMARGLMRDERPDHTLSPTALVQEVFVRLAQDDALEGENCPHFPGIAASLGVARKTVGADWTMARAWLAGELASGPG